MNYIDGIIPKEIKEEEDTLRFTLNNLKRIFTFRQEVFSPSLIREEKVKIVINERLTFEDNVIVKTVPFSAKKEKLVKKFRGFRSKSCPNSLLENGKFALFLSEDEIKIPKDLMISFLKKNPEKTEKFDEIKGKIGKNGLKLDLNSKIQSEEMRLCDNILKSAEKKVRLHIDVKEIGGNTQENSKNNEDWEEKTEEKNESEENILKNEEKSEENCENEEDEEVFKHMNPNNQMKHVKYRKRSSTSVMETEEWMILMDLMKGLCDYEQENEFKTAKIYVKL